MSDNESNDDNENLQSPFGESGIDIGEPKEDLDKIFEKMLDPKNIYHFTELSQSEITGFSTLGVLARKYDIPILKAWILDNMLMRVSKQRKGKLEFVKITARNAVQENNQQRSPWDFLRRN